MSDEAPILLDRTPDGAQAYGPYGELLIRALQKQLRAIAPIVVALHPGLFIDVLGAVPASITGNAWMAGAFALPTNVGVVRIVIAEMLPERTGLVLGLKGSRTLALGGEFT